MLPEPDLPAAPGNPTTDTTESARKRLVRSVWSAGWDRGETDAFDQLLALDYVRVATSEVPPQGRDEFKDAVLATRRAFPDLTTTIEEFVEEGERLAIRWSSTATHLGNLLGLPPTERTVAVSGVTFAQFDGDVVIEEQVTWNPRHLIQALGVIQLS